ncbi:uncharacterized protein LOC111460770 isoform X1 [Cucurbita moschata]|uniref:Uncharacterized protein LOC111460770 isoform X1 n=1 Tax=Cucurbita moschata TaxID=3662 RepID=A0A6J1H7F3_CUCMO|nr:uncharacterized protein LOC111460770 isoform X1 [Cucurbita moschata]
MEEGFNLCILISISFQFLLPTSGILNKSNELVSYSAQGTAVCSVINCGQGACKASHASFLGFDMRAVLVGGNSKLVSSPSLIVLFPTALPNSKVAADLYFNHHCHQQRWFLSFIYHWVSRTVCCFLNHMQNFTLLFILNSVNQLEFQLCSLDLSNIVFESEERAFILKFQVAGLFGVVMEPAWPIEQLCSYTLATAAKASGIY